MAERSIIMNLPTKLTVLRLILSLVIIVLLCFPFYLVGLQFPTFAIGAVAFESQYIVAGIIFIIASLTDWLDGYLARKNNQITDTGKMLDAIADKVLVNSVLIILAAHGYIHEIVPVIIVLRDIVVNAIKMEAAGKGKVVAAIGSGKLKTATLMVGTTLALFCNAPFEYCGIYVDDILLFIACLLSIVSAVQYFNINKELIFPKKAK
jgi:CDP-diacylglycerol--glycerol-3-phosphate 3-phosphatidyltransferase